MITQEEFHLMQEQLVQMSEEKNEMVEMIEKLTKENKGAKELKDKVENVKEEIRLFEESHRLDEDELSNEIAILSEREDNNSSTELENLEQQFKQYESKILDLSDIHANMALELDQIETNYQNINAQLEDYEKFISNSEVISSQLATARGLSMYIEDLNMLLQQVMGEHEIQNARKHRLEVWRDEVSDNISAKQSALHDLNENLSSILSDLQSSEQTQDQKQEELVNTKMELKRVENEIDNENSTLESENLGKENDISEFEKMRVTMENDIQQLDSQLQDKQSEIAAYPITKKKIMRKKVEMVNQLEHRMKEVKKQKTKEANDISVIKSNEVLDLTEEVGSEMQKKIHMEENINKLQEKLAHLQAEVSRKEVMIQEFSSSVPVDEPMTDEQCLEQFDDLIKEVQTKHRFFLSDLKTQGEMVNGLEQEQKSIIEVGKLVSGFNG